MAVAGTLFVCIILAIFDATAKKRTRVSVHSLDSSAVLEHVGAIYPGAKVLDLASKPESGKDTQKLVLELDLEVGADAATVKRALDAKQVPGVTRVAIED
jgi:hypothetical protein